MKRSTIALAMLICTFNLSACGNSRDAATIYVVSPSGKEALFTRDLVSIAKKHGLEPDSGQTVGQADERYSVVTAQGHWLWLWGTNVPLSGNENPTLCGHYEESHPDPGQFVVTVDHGLGRIGLNHMLAAIAPGSPEALIADISKELRALGYKVRTAPVICSPQSAQRT